jgi:hypothetical protein
MGVLVVELPDKMVLGQIQRKVAREEVNLPVAQQRRAITQLRVLNSPAG